MKNKIKIGLFALLSALFFAACDYPGYDEYVTDQLVTVTNYDTNADFDSYTSYKLYDTVVVITSSNEVTKVSIDDSPKLQNLYNAVKSSVPSKYTFKDVNADADLAIVITLVQTTNLVFADYGWWWYDYCFWYYWGCGFYPYYPYSYPVLVGGYTTGTMLMDMFDTKSRFQRKAQPVDFALPAVWTGAIRSLLTDTNTDADMNAAIKQCFDQTIPFQN